MDFIRGIFPWFFKEAKWEIGLLWTQPGAPLVSGLVLAFIVGTAIAVLIAMLGAVTGGSATGNQRSLAQITFGLYVSLGRIRNLLCSPCDRARGRFPVPATCQIPFFKDISDVYNFIWGYKTDGLFVEIGGYDGESFSNTSGLADLGWRGAYVEPIPNFAKVCTSRHAGNPEVSVHQVCVGETDGVEVEISTAGPFSSAVEDEVATVSSSGLNSALQLLGWSHTDAAATKVRCTTVSLHSFLQQHMGLAPVAPISPLPTGSPSVRARSGSVSRRAASTAQAGASSASSGSAVHAAPSSGESLTPIRAPGKPLGPIDLLVIDVEGLEWPILRTFPIAAWRPAVVIIEIQELQARYRNNTRVQADAAALFNYFKDAGYSILYKDVVNTVFVHKDLPIHGGA